MRRSALVLFVGLSVALLSSLAQAAPLAPGALVFPMPIEPDPVGGVVLATSALPFVSANYSGTLTSTVLSGDTSNPFVGSGGLTFTYVLSNLAGTDSINRISINGFASFLLDASSQTPPPAGTAVPAYVDRELLGNSIGFTFAPAPLGGGTILTGQSSSTLVVQSNATGFTPSTAFVLDGVPAGVATFAPVPEPSTIVLVAGSALALTTFWLRRRHIVVQASVR